MTLKLLQKLSYFTLRAIRLFPFAAALDDQRYDRIEQLIDELPNNYTPHRASTLFLNLQIIRQSTSVRYKYRVINSANLSDADRRWLSKAGFNADIIANINSYSNPANDLYTNVAPTDDLDSESADFQLDAFKSSKVSITCPFTGNILDSTKSILAAENQPIFYRFESRAVIYLAIGRAGAGYPKLYLYIPRKDAIILLADEELWNGRDEVDQFRSYMINNSTDIFNYLTNPRPPITCALIDCNHFAHHLWNNLTGIEKVIKSSYVDYIDKLIVAAEPFGPLEQVFPQLLTKTVERHSYPKLLRDSLRHNWFLFRPGDNKISKSLVSSLLASANENCSRKMLEEAHRFRKKYWPILWVTIRTENRTWISQSHGIASIANRLSEEFPNLALVIDGFCVPYGHPHTVPTTQERLINKEMECVLDIKENLTDTIPVHVNISHSLLESVLFAGVTDFYFAHHGSLQHKIGWIANCHGVVHSNNNVLRNPKGKHRATCSREDALLPVYLDAEYVVDISNDAPKDYKLRWEDSLENYDFDYQSALELIRLNLRNLAR